MVGRWFENEARELIEEYQSADLISDTQQVELLALVSEGKARIAIDILLSAI